MGQLSNWRQLKLRCALSLKKLRTFFLMWLKNHAANLTSDYYLRIELKLNQQDQILELCHFNLNDKKVKKPPENRLGWFKLK